MSSDVLRPRKVLAVITAATSLVLTAPLIEPAVANHPPNTCLDLTPETASNPTGQAHTITATLRLINAGPPQTCSQTEVTIPAGSGPVMISFELAGANDPDGGDTPDSPDNSCLIPEGSSSCTITYTGTEAGTDTIRGWIDHDGKTPAQGGVTEADRTEGRDEAAQPGTGCFPPGTPPTPEPDCTDVVTKTWTASRLDCEPETDSNPSGQPHTITCTATDEEGNRVSGTEIDAEYTGAGDPDDADAPPPDADNACTTRSDDPLTPANEAGTCSFSHTSNEAGTTTYRMWIDDDGNDTNTDEGDTDEAPAEADTDDTDVTQKTWTASRLNCEPETKENPVGTSHTVTCTATDQQGNPVEGTKVDAEATGAGDPDGGNSPPPDFTCTTGPDGTCSFTHSSNQSGTTTYRAWIDDDNNDTNVNEGDTAEPHNPNPGQEDNDDTDVVTKTWTAGEPATLDCDDQSGDDRETNPSGSGPNSDETYTCTVRDEFGNPVSGRRVNGENENGVNDPENPDSASHNTPDYGCTTGDNGTCTIKVTQADAETGTGEICFWTGPTDDPDTPEDESQGATQCADEPTDEPESNDTADQVEKTWRPTTPTQATRLDCRPETDANPQGTTHTITCRVTNNAGSPVAGAEVDVEASGANDPDNNTNHTTPDFTCVTGNDGECTISHGPDGTGTTNQTGVTSYRAWIDADNQNSTSEADMNEGRDEQTQPGTGCTPPQPGLPEPDCTDVVEKTWGASRLDCEPETDSNPAGTTHTITCTARDANNTLMPNVEVDAEATGANDPDNSNTPNSPDFTCTTGEDGTCQIVHGDNEDTGSAGTTTYRAWIDADKNNSTNESDPDEQRDETTPTGRGRGCSNPPTFMEPDCTDVVEKTWTASRLDCEPETSTGGTGTSHRVTCTATDEKGNRVANTRVDAEATGANDPDDSDSPESPDFTCTTDSNGQCSFTHGPSDTDEEGTTTYRAWIDQDNNNSTVEADRGEGRDESAAPGNEAEPDGTDVVERNWVPSPLECEPETDGNPAGSSHTITCTARDENNQPRQGEVIDAEATGANDPDNSDSPESPDFTCTTNAQGRCSFTHSGSENETGTTTYRAWTDEGSDAEVEADREEGRDESSEPGSQPEPDETDVVEKRWGATGLNCRPETARNPTGSSHTVTCHATHDDNDVSGEEIDVEATGANDPDDSDSPESPDFTCETNDDGECSFTHGPEGTGESGTTTYRAWTDTDRDNSTSEADADEARGEEATAGEDEEPDDTDVVEKEWTPGRFDCDPESDVNPTNSSHTVTCTVRDENGLVQGADVDVEASGTNDPDSSNSPASPDFSCSTDENGSCSFTHSGATGAEGTTTYRAWIDADSNNQTTEADAGEGRNESAQPGDEPETDDTDVVQKDWVRDNPRGCTIEGTDEGETIVGTPAADVICAGGGNDEVRSQGGDDVVYGDGGNDLVNGGGGHDDLRGNAGEDKIFGRRGKDKLSGGGATDVLLGGGQIDVIRGNNGTDILRGLGGNDELFGNNRADVLEGGEGNDALAGGTGDDALDGGEGNDDLSGQGGDDGIQGGDGRDTLTGGAGRDDLDGGPDRDTCSGGPGRDEERRC